MLQQRKWTRQHRRLCHWSTPTSVTDELPNTDKRGRQRARFAADAHHAINQFPPFDDFKTPAVPRDLDTYREYRRRTIGFVEARNRRIERHAAASP